MTLCYLNPRHASNQNPTLRLDKFKLSKIAHDSNLTTNIYAAAFVFAFSSFSALRKIFPTLVLGSSVRNSTYFGTL